MKTLIGSINKGLEFLINFTTSKSYKYDTIFPASLILNCLNSIEIEPSKIAAKYFISLIEKEKSQSGTFNYWLKASIKYKEEPYPDDLDDTVCCASGLYGYNKNLVSEQEWAKLVNTLIICEAKTGGPYRTWIVPKDKSKNWDDIDLVVNSNIAFLLRQQNIELKNITKFIDKYIQNNEIKSPYYKNEIIVIYFISKSYSGKLAHKLKNRLLLQHSENSLEKAMIVSSLLRLGYPEEIPKGFIKEIIEKQQNDGCWEPTDLYYYKSKDSKYIGSKEITTAFVLEALYLYNESKNKASIRPNKFNQYKKKTDRFLEQIILTLPNNIRIPAQRYIKNILKRDPEGKIFYFPLRLYLSLSFENQKRITIDEIIKLGVANILHWLAYTIYDDITDKDKATYYLPMANILRWKANFLTDSLKLNEETGFKSFFNEEIIKSESITWWELRECNYTKFRKTNKLPSYNTYNLALRSIGAALLPMAVLFYLDINVKCEETDPIYVMFANILTGRQIADDLHDWQDDFRADRINSIGALLMESVLKTKKLYLLDNDEDLKLFFWQSVLDDGCNLILKTCKRAKKILKKINYIEDKTYFFDLINLNENSAKKATEERNRALKFIEAYY